MGIFKFIAQGGQIWAHCMRMVKQVVKIALLSSIIVSLTFFVIALLRIPQRIYQGTWYYFKARYLTTKQTCEVKGSYWRQYHLGVDSSRVIVVPKTLLLKRSKKEKDTFFSTIRSVVLTHDSLSFGIFILFLLFFLVKGIMVRKGKHLSGIRQVSAWRAKMNMRITNRASNIYLGKVPLPKQSSTKHILISGTTGTGKSTCLRQLLHNIRKRKERAVVIDTTCEFVSNFYRDTDVMLNPFDQRTVDWDPWCECYEAYHFEQLVNSLIPDTNQYDQFFSEASRAILYSALKKAKDTEYRNIESFVDFLLCSDVQELYEELNDTDAALYLDPKGERTTLSIRATLSNVIRNLRCLKTSLHPFSIREWIISDQKDEWLFLSSTTEQREALTPLISMWFSIAMNALKSRKQREEKIWFIIDELPTLEKLGPLESSLAEFRKYGGCLVLVVQDFSQLDQRYGIHAARTIIDLCGTKVCFRQSDAEVARRMANCFGEKEIREIQESLSYGAHEMRDGVSLSTVNKSKLSVSPSEILNLRDMEAYVRFPGCSPFFKTRFKHQKFRVIAQDFEPRNKSITN